MAAVLSANAADRFVTFTTGDVQLNVGGQVSIYVDQNDERGVVRAARTLCADFGRVTGTDAQLMSPAGGLQGASILIGTLGHSAAIDQMVKEKRIDLSALKGKRETYMIQLVGQQLVIAGSDRRGTIFGIYELSRQMGVSPWYYWADVPTVHHDCIYVNQGT